MAKGPRRDGSKEAGWRLLIAEQASSRLSVRGFLFAAGRFGSFVLCLAAGVGSAGWRSVAAVCGSGGWRWRGVCR